MRCSKMNAQILFLSEYLVLLIILCIKMSHGACDSKRIFAEGKSNFNPHTGNIDTKDGILLSENVICKNLEDMRSTDNLCRETICSISFTEGNLSVIPTNSFIALKKVDDINLADSKIETLQTGVFSGLMNVRKIQLQRNAIQNISRGIFNSLIHITFLDLHMNNISSIEDESFHGLQSLEYLDLSFNKLSIIPGNAFKPLIALKTLNVSNNDLTTTSLQFVCYLSVLNSLVLDYNKVDNIEPCFMKSNITVLSLSGNILSGVKGFSFPSTLNKLYLANNNISQLSLRSFQNLKILEKMDLSHNHIKSLPIGIFREQQILTSLNLSENEIGYLQHGIFSNLENLKILDVSHNKLNNSETDIFIPLISLKILDVGHNNIKSFNMTYLFKFSQLTTLKISHNPFVCKNLANILYFGKKNKVNIPNGDILNSENINGIPCSHSLQAEQRTDSSLDFRSGTQNVVKTEENDKNLIKALQNLKKTAETLTDTIGRTYNKGLDKKTNAGPVFASINNIPTELVSGNKVHHLGNFFSSEMSEMESDFINKNIITRNEINKNPENFTIYQNFLDKFLGNFSKFLNKTKTQEEFNAIPNSNFFWTYQGNESLSGQKKDGIFQELSRENKEIVVIFNQIRLLIIVIVLVSLLIYGFKVIKHSKRRQRQKSVCSSIEIPILNESHNSRV